EVHLSRVRVVETGSVGVIASGGFLVAEDCEVEKSGAAALQLGGKTKVVLERLAVRAPADAGVVVHERASVRLDGSRLVGCGAAAVDARGTRRVVVLDTTVE